MNQYVVNDKFEFSFDENSQADLLKVGENKYHIINDGVSSEIEVLDRNDETLTYVVKINGKILTVNYKTELMQLLEEMGMDAASAAMVSEINAPMPGLVLDILVKEGDEVSKNDSVIVLEAMKMENVLKSPIDGKIKSVVVQKGQNVEKNQVLIAFE